MMGSFRDTGSVESELLRARCRRHQFRVQLEQLVHSPSKSGLNPAEPAPPLVPPHPAGPVYRSSPNGKVKNLHPLDSAASVHQAQRHQPLQSWVERLQPALAPMDRLSTAEACNTFYTVHNTEVEQLSPDQLHIPLQHASPERLHIPLQRSLDALQDVATHKNPDWNDQMVGQSAIAQLRRSEELLRLELEAVKAERDFHRSSAIDMKAQLESVMKERELAMFYDAKFAKQLSGQNSVEERATQLQDWNRIVFRIVARNAMTELRDKYDELSRKYTEDLAGWTLDRVTGNALARSIQKQVKDLVAERAELQQKVADLSHLPEFLKEASMHLEATAAACQRTSTTKIELLQLLQSKKEQLQAREEELMLTNASYAQLSQRLESKASEVDALQNEVHQLRITNASLQAAKVREEMMKNGLTTDDIDALRNDAQEALAKRLG